MCHFSVCQISFVIDKDIKGPLLVYYELTNYHQNHRRYVTSYSSSQLLGAVSCNFFHFQNDEINVMVKTFTINFFIY